MTNHLLTEVRDGIATATLNRPDVLNALSPDMMAALIEFLGNIERDRAVRCVVFRGAGDHFMAGGDVKRFAGMADMTGEERRKEMEASIHRLHPAIFLLRRMPKPVIASVRGAAAGFGLSLAMACDLVIASEDSFFTLAYVNIGTSPDGSGTYFLPRLVGLKKAMEIALLGDRFDAAAARAMGVVNFVVPTDELEAETTKLARRLADGPTRAIGNTKRLLNASLGRSLESQLEAEALAFADCASTDDWAEGVTAFVEKRAPRFRGE